MRRTSFLLAVALLGAASSARAQTAIGQVVSLSTKRPLSGVRVVLVDDSARVVAVTTTDSAQGSFFVDAPRPGRYRIALYTATGASFVGEPMMLDSAPAPQQIYVLPEIPDRFAGVKVAAQVSKTAVPHRDAVGPRFPDELLRSQTRGSVAIAVVVDSTGRPLTDSMEVLFSSDPRFSQAVKRALERTRFSPAELNGVPVAQLAQITYAFRFAGDSLPAGDVVTTATGITRRIEIHTRVETIAEPSGRPRRP